MNIEEARKIVSHVVSERLRWNKHYTADDVGLDQLLQALIAIAHVLDDQQVQANEEADGRIAELKAELTKVNRQLAAAKAREAKAKKKEH